MTATYSYQSILDASERCVWRVEDLIGGEKRLDFSKRFLPESLARTGELEFLNADERRTLSQIRGHEYLVMFGLVEEFILPFVLDHVRTRLNGDSPSVRAFLSFADEEAKHIHLFRRFREEFERGFGRPCAVIGPAKAVADKVLSHHPLAVALTILHIEWMTQRHFLESIREDGSMDPLFKSLLKHHWMEEAQHAKLDSLMVDALADVCSSDEVHRAFAEYLQIGGFLDQGLRQQALFNLETLERSTGRRLTEEERERTMASQVRALRWTYLGSGMTHPEFLRTLEKLDPAIRRRMQEEIAPSFC